jgi:predicted nuclease of predicted toxin-antitoxin system
MHFKLDENIPLKLGNIIKIKGHSVSSVFSENISGIDDKSLLKICKDENYILITLDKDFVSSSQKGIIILSLKNQGNLSVINAFENFTKEVNLQRTKYSLIIIEENNIRIR